MAEHFRVLISGDYHLSFTPGLGLLHVVQYGKSSNLSGRLPSVYFVAPIKSGNDF